MVLFKFKFMQVWVIRGQLEGISSSKYYKHAATLKQGGRSKSVMPCIANYINFQRLFLLFTEMR